MVAKTIKRKKNTEKVKKELLNSLKESDTVKERDFNIQKFIDQRETGNIIKHYEEIIKIGNKKTIRYEVIQGQIWKDLLNFRLSRSSNYFKVGLDKFLKKYDQE